MVKSVIAKFVQWLGYGLGNRGSSVRFPARAKHSSTKYSDCFSCPPSLLVNYYWRLFPHGQRAMHLITHVCYMLSLRMSGAIPHPPYTFMPFTPTMVSLSGRSYTTDRQMATQREKACMYNWQFWVLWSVSSSSFYRKLKLLPEPWYTTFPLLTSTPYHKQYSSEEIQQAAKKSPSK